MFKSLDAAAKEDNVIDAQLNMSEVFGCWTNQRGFPLLKVARNADGSLTLSQEKYTEIAGSKITDESWWIPYNFDTKKKWIDDWPGTTTPSGWLPKGKKSQVIELNEDEKLRKNDWILFNRQQTSYYRVLYDEQNYRLLLKELWRGSSFIKIHQINRAQIIDDLAAFAYSNRVSPKLFFDALKTLTKEKKFAPWIAAQRAIKKIDQILDASEEQPQFRALVASVVEPVYKNQFFLDKLAIVIVEELACEFLDLGCKFPSVNVFTFEFIWMNFFESDSQDKRQAFFYIMTTLRDKATINLSLNRSVGKLREQITKADRLAIITSILSGQQMGVKLTLAFLRREMEEVNATIGSFTTILKSIAERIVSEDVRNEVCGMAYLLFALLFSNLHIFLFHLQFIRLLEQAKSSEILSDSEVTDLTKLADEKLDWQNKNLKRFEDGLSSSLSSDLFSSFTTEDPDELPTSLSSRASITVGFVFFLCIFASVSTN